LLAEFTLWTLIVWGFTASMLMSLARAGRPVSCEEWIGDDTDGRTIDVLTLDRLRLLGQLGLAVRQNGRVVMTAGAGLRMARFARLLRLFVGLPV
jgi:hypothetical protein